MILTAALALHDVCTKLRALLRLNERIFRTMTDVAKDAAQVDATLAVMAQAVVAIQADVAALAAAQAANDGPAVDELFAKLKTGTDALAAVLPAVAPAPAPAPVAPTA